MQRTEECIGKRLALSVEDVWVYVGSDRYYTRSKGHGEYIWKECEACGEDSPEHKD
jgi:hypothetical protein